MSTLVMSRGIVDQPSQWLNIGFIILTVGLYFIHPLLGFLFSFFLLWKILVLRFWTWIYTGDSIVERKGVFSVTTEEIQYFRIKDVELYEPFLYRLVGLSKIYVYTSDWSKPTIVLNGIYDGQMKRDMIKKMALNHRRKEGVREFDFR